MKRLTVVLGYAAAVLTIAVAVLGPLFWFGFFSRVAAATSLRIDPVYSGGEPARSLGRNGYEIVVYKPVAKRSPLSQAGAFVQVVWRPASKLPAAVSESLDIDGDGRPDCSISFQVPPDPKTKMHVTEEPLAAFVLSMHQVSRDSFSSLIARVNDTIVVRVPLR